MVKTESECVGCSNHGLYCLKDSCPNYEVKRYYCDECGDEVEDLYEFEGEELCIYCIEKRLKRVE